VTCHEAVRHKTTAPATSPGKIRNTPDRWRQLFRWCHGPTADVLRAAIEAHHSSERA